MTTLRETKKQEKRQQVYPRLTGTRRMTKTRPHVFPWLAQCRGRTVCMELQHWIQRGGTWVRYHCRGNHISQTARPPAVLAWWPAALSSHLSGALFSLTTCPPLKLAPHSLLPTLEIRGGHTGPESRDSSIFTLHVASQFFIPRITNYSQY